MTAPDLVEVVAAALAEHWSVSTHTDREPFVDKCDGCGEVILTWGDVTVTNGADRHAKHQAEALALAGFGNLHDAWAEGVQFAHNHDVIYHYDNPYPAPKVSET